MLRRAARAGVISVFAPSLPGATGGRAHAAHPLAYCALHSLEEEDFGLARDAVLELLGLDERLRLEVNITIASQLGAV